MPSAEFVRSPRFFICIEAFVLEDKGERAAYLSRVTDERPRETRISNCSRPTRPAASVLSSMCQPPPREAVRNALDGLISPGVAVHEIQRIPSLRLPRTYNIRLSDGTGFLLVLPPPSIVRLMRSEQCLIQSEAVVSRWLADVLDVEQEVGGAVQVEHSQATVAGVSASTKQRSPSSSGSTEGRKLLRKYHRDSDRFLVLPLLPKLVSHSPTRHREIAAPFSIFRSQAGAPISSLEIPLSPRQRRSVDAQVGRFLSRLALLTSPTGEFGSAFQVLAPEVARQIVTRTGSIPSVPYWSRAFRALLEGVLRDGEDMTVTLPYTAIRKHVDRLSHLFDSVTNARFVIIDGHDDSNILVTTRPRTGSSRKRMGESRNFKTGIKTPPDTDKEATDEESVDQERGHGHDDGGDRSSNAVSDDGDSGDEADEAGKDDDGGGDDDNEGGNDEDSSDYDHDDNDDYDDDNDDDDGIDIEVTGLRDWSKCMFGDPLLTRVFSEDPPQHFLDAFHGKQKVHGFQDGLAPRRLVDDECCWPVRLLFYKMYHTLCNIIQTYYRPPSEGSKHELESRRRLNGILKQLEQVEADPKRRHRRPSGAVSPAKRIKEDESEIEPKQELA